MSKVLFSEADLVTVEEVLLADGLLGIRINHRNCQAMLSLYGGHVLSWQPSGEQEVFWLSKTSAYQVGKAIRGGIPICWPWFGPLEGTNQHGFARVAAWQLDNIDADENGVTIDISWQGENIDKLWPYAVKVKQRLFFGQSFKQTFVIENLSSQDFKYTGALHSYFAISHPENVTVPALDNVRFYDKLQDDVVDGVSRNNCVGPIDTVHYCAESQKIIDTGLKRIIAIDNDNTHQWVLWNPGKETADNMADVHNGGENEYVCLEAANTEWQTVKAGETVSFSQTIVVEKF